jgi:hypothetical protein
MINSVSVIPVATTNSQISSPADLASVGSHAKPRSPNGNEPSVAWRENLTDVVQRLQAGHIDTPSFAAFYFLHWSLFRHGEALASRKRKSDPRPDVDAWTAELAAGDASPRREWLLTILERYQFRGIIANVPTALCQWLRGTWRLELRDEIPTPRDVLRAQAHGVRPVTAITAYPRLLQPVLRHADAFAFFVHDLEHAYKFFHSPALYAGQCTFFAALEAALDRGVFAPYFADSTFVEKFHYAMSDMNTHPEHSRRYLRAILIEFYLRCECKPAAAPISPAAERDIDAVLQNFATSG